MSILTKRLRVPVIVIAAVLPVLVAVVNSISHAANICADSPYKGKKLSPEELKKIIQDHAEWLSKHKINYESDEARKDKRRADLSQAVLRGADMRGVDLSRAKLSDADLSKAILWSANLGSTDLKTAKLIGADLINANLSHAIMWGADLSNTKLISINLREADLSNVILRSADLTNADLWGARLINANLCEAKLGDAKLNHAILWGADLSSSYIASANLTKADLGGANLENAILWRANMSSAKMNGTKMEKADLRWNDPEGIQGTDLNEAIFEPNTLPDIVKFAFVKNLEKMKYETNPQELKKLRNEFRKAEYNVQERKITYAIKHCETMIALNSGKYVEAFLSGLGYIFFEFTTQWGMAPWRAIQILLCLILIFIIPYVIALRLSGANGIYYNCMRPGTENTKTKRLHLGFCQAVIFGAYFSLFSAFSICLRGYDVGNWIQRLHPHEHTLKAAGWVRTVSGIQALISFYLLAIWALTYSSRPFD